MSINVAIQPGLTPSEVTVQVAGHTDAQPTAEIITDEWGIDDLAKVADGRAKAWNYRDVDITEVVWDVSTLDTPALLTPGSGSANFLVDPKPLWLRMAGTGGRLLEIQEEVVLADRAVWDNRGNPDRRHFAATMSVTSSTSVSSSWSRSQTVGIAAEIGTSIGPVDAKTTISYTDSWGEEHGESKGQDVSFSNEIKGELKPGELQVAALTQQRGFAHIETDYDIVIAPAWFDNSVRRGPYIGFRGHAQVRATYDPQPWISYDRFAIRLTDLLERAGKPVSASNSRIDVIGVFADAVLASYPIPDTSPGSIEAAAGVHPITVTFRAGPA